jgi:hypothetical protein
MNRTLQQVIFVVLMLGVPVATTAYLVVDSDHMMSVFTATGLLTLVLWVWALIRTELSGSNWGDLIDVGLIVWLKWSLGYVGLCLVACIYVQMWENISAGVILLCVWAVFLALFATACQACFGVGRFRPRVDFPRAARRLLRRRLEFTIGGPRYPNHIAEVEGALGLPLPKSYKEFLLHFGEIRSFSIRFLGLCPGMDLQHPTEEDCIGATQFARKRFGLPWWYLLCAVDAEGQLLCVNTSGIANSDGPVIAWDAEKRREGHFVAANFGELLLQRLRAKG